VVDDWLLGVGAAFDVEAAAAPPATTTARARMRMTSFMLVTSLQSDLTEDISSARYES
jgi:hypothetical protein